MSKLSQTMKMISGSTTYQVPFYTTTGEASAFGTYGTANVGGTTCYYGLGTGADKAHGSEVKTPLKVVKSSTTYYMLTKGSAELTTYTLTLSAMTTNQKISLKYKNRNNTDSGYETEVSKTSTSSSQSYTVRKGTTWTASVLPDEGYAGGTLSPGSKSPSGGVTANTTISVTAATIKAYTLKIRDQLYINGSFKYPGWSGSFKYTTSITVARYSADSLIKVYKGTSTAGTLWLTKTTNSFSFNMPASNVYIIDESPDLDCDCDGDG